VAGDVARVVGGQEERDPGNFLGLSTGDVAAGLAAAVNGDATGQFKATVSGSDVTITGPAFTVQIAGTAGIQSSSHAYEHNLDVALSGTVSTGQVWQISLNGVKYTYVANQNDDLTDVAAGLSQAISAFGFFTKSAWAWRLATVMPGL